jgi:hypothetical protein
MDDVQPVQAPQDLEEEILEEGAEGVMPTEDEEAEESESNEDAPAAE